MLRYKVFSSHARPDDPSTDPSSDASTAPPTSRPVGPGTRHESGIYPRSIDPGAVLQVLSGAETGVWSYESGAKHIVASPTARGIIGPDENAELPVEGWLDRVHPADRERVCCEIDRVRAEECSFAFEVRIFAVDGESTWVELHGRSHHEAGQFVRAAGTVRCSSRQGSPLREGPESSIVCARRPANLGMIAASVVDAMQDLHPSRTIHLALSGHLDGEWDPERLAQALSDLVADSLDGRLDWPVIVRVSGRRSEVQVVIEGAAAPGGPGVSTARQIVRAHGGALLEQTSDEPGTRFLAVLPRRAH